MRRTRQTESALGFATEIRQKFSASAARFQLPFAPFQKFDPET
jgi:hypothetical protein